MCFSAAVSFTSSGLLAASGIIGTYFAVRGNKRFIPLNMMSFFYVIQQFSEGMIWVRSPILTPNNWAMLFLFFAFFVYPWYQSFACYFITKDESRQKKIFWIGCFAFVFGAMLYVNVLMTPDLGADLCRLHIFYDVLFLGKYSIVHSFLIYLITLIYVFFTSVPFFLSDMRYAKLLGWTVFVSAVLCWFIYYDYFISVWCFYSAIFALFVAVYSYYEWYKRKRKLMKQMRD